MTGSRVEHVTARFRESFGRAPHGFAQAPGRVNIIGEHIDYNDGFVLPCAIERSALCAWASRDDARVHAISLDYAAETVFDVADVGARHGDWQDYVRGVVQAMVRAGHAVGGADIVFTSDVPVGAGLSSSAAVEVCIAGALRAAHGLHIDDVELALLCQRAENEYVGVQSGIMDQFASALCRPGHALLLDCRSLEIEHVPLRLAECGLALVIADSGARRELVSSAYNDRRRECEDALAAIVGATRARGPGAASWREISIDDVERAALPEVLRRRARHVVTEIARVQTAAAALRADDFAMLGELMAQSHASLRDDYEVSTSQLDLLVELASAQSYVIGARLTGAGFGGCTVNIVRAEAVSDLERDVIQPYRARTGLDGQALVTGAGAGLSAESVTSGDSG